MSWQDDFQKALHFAADAHGDQKYPGKDYSYVVHLTLVAMEVTAAIAGAAAKGSSPDATLAVSCALLHDTLEDTGTEFDDLAKAFGTEVAEGVKALTKDKSVEKPRRMTDCLERIMARPKEVWMVKMADRITNLQPPPASWTAEKVAAYRIEAESILAALGGADSFLAARLAAKIKAYGA